MRHVTRDRGQGKQRGIVSLVLVLVLGGIIVELSLAGILLVTLLNNENFGIQLSIRALAAAQSGISEGLLRLVRNKDFILTNGGFSSLTPFDTGSATTQVGICRGFRSGSLTLCGPMPQDGVYEIVSVGTAFTRKRELVAVAEVDAVSGLVTLTSLKEQ